MDPFHFSISAEAVHFFQRLVHAAESDDDLVLTVAPETDAVVFELEKEALDQAIAGMVKDARGRDLRELKFRWTVGASRRSRFPPEDILICDGVSCFIPIEMRPVLNGRTLIVAEGELRIVPDPPPPPPLV
jgi:hypothetical protein